MSAKTIETGRIAGALKCMNALRQLQQSAEAPGQDDTVEAYFAQRLSDTRALVAALGPMTPELEGAIATLMNPAGKQKVREKPEPDCAGYLAHVGKKKGPVGDP